MENYSFREMTASDVDALAAWMIHVPLWARYGLTAECAAAQFHEALARHDLLLIETSRVAFAWVMPRGAFGRSPYLRLIGVHPQTASRGVGSALLQAVESRARVHGDRLFLLVSDFNQDAQRFYQRHGYTQAGALPDYVVAGVTEYLFWKRLAGNP